MTKFIYFLILFSVSVHAQDVCTRSQDDIKRLISDVSSRVAFKNQGGFFNGGVCWWHSRLQRSSAYLVKFAPSEVRPSGPELDFILHSLRVMNKVVTIPGYSDFAT